MTTYSLPTHPYLLQPTFAFDVAAPGIKCQDCKLLPFCITDPERAACARFTSLDPSCPGCRAKRLADCDCSAVLGYSKKKGAPTY